MTTKTPINQLRCRRCKELKPRQAFKPKAAGSFNYDYMCNTCRQKKPYIDPYTMKKRIASGLVSPKQAEQHSKRLQAAYKLRAARAERARCRATWDKPFKSAQFAYRRVINFVAP